MIKNELSTQCVTYARSVPLALAEAQQAATEDAYHRGGGGEQPMTSVRTAKSCGFKNVAESHNSSSIS
jgi:hypothetical protein